MADGEKCEGAGEQGARVLRREHRGRCGRGQRQHARAQHDFAVELRGSQRQRLARKLEGAEGRRLGTGMFVGEA